MELEWRQREQQWSSTIVSICRTPSPPPAADVICEQPLNDMPINWQKEYHHNYVRTFVWKKIQI